MTLQRRQVLVVAAGASFAGAAWAQSQPGAPLVVAAMSWRERIRRGRWQKC